jgi:CBS domain-containing protein
MSIQAILYQKGAKVETITPDASVKDAAARLQKANIAALVATKGDAILGIISEREIVHALSNYGERAASMNVGDILVRDFATVAPEDSLRRAMSLMTRHRTRHLPVLRGSKLVGIVSIGDVIKHRLEDLELETNVLRDAYIAVH